MSDDITFLLLLDADECHTDDMCGKGQCVNMVGGFDCKCESGFTPGSDGKCQGLIQYFHPLSPKKN